jgi:Mor family transcriptional regulator
MVDKTLQNKRNQAIFNEYAEMWGKQGMREDLIFEKLSEKYFLCRDTVYRIILKQSKTAKQSDK